MSDRFTVVTWNVLYRDRNQRVQLVAERIRAVRPDVLLLQETSPDHAAALAEATGMCVACVAPDGSADPVSVPAVLTARPPVAAGTISLTGANEPLRHYAHATIELAGIPVRVATTHLQHTPGAWRLGIDRDYAAAAHSEAEVESIRDDEIRASVQHRLAELTQIAAIRADLQPLPEVFGGDLNFVPRGPEYERIRSWGMFDSWADGPRLGSGATILGTNPFIHDGPSTGGRDGTTVLPGHRGPIDYTLDFQFHTARLRTDRAWTLGNADEAGRWPSDHLGLAVEYSLCES